MFFSFFPGGRWRCLACDFGTAKAMARVRFARLREEFRAAPGFEILQFGARPTRESRTASQRIAGQRIRTRAVRNLRNFTLKTKLPRVISSCMNSSMELSRSTLELLRDEAYLTLCRTACEKHLQV